MSVVWEKVGHMFDAIDKWWLGHVWVDRAIAAFVVVAHTLLVLRFDWPTLLDAIQTDRRAPLYAASATVVSLTGTLASLSVGQYLSGRGDRVLTLKRVFGPELGRVWKGTFLGSAVAALLLVVAMGIDLSVANQPWGALVFELAILLAATKFLRLALLFGRLIGLVVLDDTAPVKTPVAEIDESGFARH